MHESELSGRVVRVTGGGGGGGGIGGAKTAALLERSATVYCTDLVGTPPPAGSDPARFRPVRLDVTKRTEVQQVAGEIVATNALTYFLSKELASAGVTVNAVAPGPIVTGMTTDYPSALRDLIPVGRMGLLDDVVRGVMVFASADNGFVHGEVLDVNGGVWCDQSNKQEVMSDELGLSGS